MSADNGYILRRNEEGKYVLQMYFASADEFPKIDGPGEQFDTLVEAILRYEERDTYTPENPWTSEYNLSVSIKEVTKRSNE